MERRQQHPAAADIILKLALARDLQQVYAGLSLNRLKVFVDELERVLEQRRFARALGRARPPVRLPRVPRILRPARFAPEPRRGRPRPAAAGARPVL